MSGVLPADGPIADPVAVELPDDDEPGPPAKKPNYGMVLWYFLCLRGASIVALK